MSSLPTVTTGFHGRHLRRSEPLLWRIAEVPTPIRLLAVPTVFKTVLRAVAVNNPYICRFWWERRNPLLSGRSVLHIRFAADNHRQVLRFVDFRPCMLLRWLVFNIDKNSAITLKTKIAWMKSHFIYSIRTKAEILAFSKTVHGLRL